MEYYHVMHKTINETSADRVIFCTVDTKHDLLATML